jgi:hypothetical protein
VRDGVDAREATPLLQRHVCLADAHTQLAPRVLRVLVQVVALVVWWCSRDAEGLEDGERAVSWSSLTC